MKATISPIALSKELKKMSSIVKKNHIVPITSAVLFQFSKDKLVVTGTNLDTTYVISLECSCEEEFSFPIDYFDISSICANCFMPLTIQLKEDEILLKTDEPYKNKLPRVGASIDFPLLPEDNFTHEKEVEGDFFYHLSHANSCRFKTDNQPALEMAAIIICKKEMDVVGCDGFYMYKKTFEEKSDFELTIMVPDSFVSLCRSFQQTTLSFGERFIKAVYNNETVISRLSESKYVNIKAIIPAEIKYNMEVGKDELKLSLNKISVAAHLTTKQFLINFKKEKIELVSQDMDFNKESETAITTKHSVDFPSIMFNSSQLLHLSTLVDTDKMEFSFTKPNQNTYIRPKDDNSILMLLRPLMLAN
jgi:DNA polymerase-3 subunit beta